MCNKTWQSKLVKFNNVLYNINKFDRPLNCRIYAMLIEKAAGFL